MDPLSFDVEMTDVSTDMPRLVKGEYPFVVKSAEVVPNKDQTGRNLLVIFSLTQPAQTHTGDIAHPGYELRKYYPLQQSPKENAPDFRRDIAILLDAAFKVTDPAERPRLNQETISALVQRPVVLKVIQRDTDDFGLQNEIKAVLPVD